MSPDEFDQLLHDAEVKLARLRALYEQYFQGIEKMEPHVPRKDMDRALEFLKKNQPRNTALRFRTQQLSARYGTYITYWQRIARQIEEGTFKRDLLRAQKVKARVAQPQPEPSAWEIEVDVDVDAIEEAATPLPAPTRAAPAFDDTDVDAILSTLGPRRSATPGPATSSTAAPSSTPQPSASPPVAATAKRTGLTAFGALAKKAPAAAAKPATPVPGPLPERPQAAAPRPAPAPPAAAAVQPAAAPRPAAAPAARPPEAASAPATGLVPRPTAAAPMAPARPAGTFARPAGAAVPVIAPPPAARPADLDSSTLKDLYDRYSEARRKNNEGAVRFETLKDSVDKMLPKLREKYGDKRVDFEVVVQNGRVGLKPKVGG